MAGRVEGKVAFITGAARGQGRSHARRLAEEGADIIAVDIASPELETVDYEMGSAQELAETARQVEALGRKAVTAVADVRSQEQLDAAVAKGLDALGRIDIVCANAGVLSMAPTWEMTESRWQTTLDINLTGVWHTCKAVAPAMIEAGNGGSIVITSSMAYHQGVPNIANYVAAKHGAVGLMRSLANELGPHLIRVNSVAPTNVNTKLLLNESVMRVFNPDKDEPTAADMAEAYRPLHILPLAWVEPVDISNAVLYLASDEGRYVTGTVLSVDLGLLAKFGMN
ncbi:mycofactocin-coupled SDR family oxidoreductase [Amycolatopsis acidicola]|uniref:Mycofactocin-coupled SDR family oxidoreductase n=1 Tax=Amycolatopsis acidicola TaxID=2596893 RepID=A0A5N0UTR6_9PSEU|nr:mycofactocin-coupled SDR family oxidoreductase [Amycolatopsis acidicola]KAA9153440.1 mycofactocin-coupled SDR family oxidoreductase [Amycolatopsis acidicola]